MLKVAIIGGDGVGPEVVAEGLKVLEAVSKKVGFEYTTKDFDVSGKGYLARGGDPDRPSIAVISDDEIQQLKTYDAIYLGAVGTPEIAPGILEKGLLLRLRFELDQFVNLRPVKLYPHVPTPLKDKTTDEIDFVVVRENTEGLYTGMGGVQYKNTPAEVSTQIMCSTRFGAERCLRYTFELARRRKKQGYPGQVTLVHKTNVLTHCGGTWFRAFEELGLTQYSDIERNYHHVDACCMYQATQPEIYDTIVVPNMFGDIITDLGAAIAGGMGFAGSGNLNHAGGVSMFEPVHGSAPDIAGKGLANPVAAIASLAMLLRETGNNRADEKLIEAGDRVEDAIIACMPKIMNQATGKMTLGTAKAGDMVAEALDRAQ